MYKGCKSAVEVSGNTPSGLKETMHTSLIKLSLESDVQIAVALSCAQIWQCYCCLSVLSTGFISKRMAVNENIG